MYKIHKAYYKKCIKTKADIHAALLHTRATLLELGLLSPASLLFTHPIWSIMPIINRLPIKSYNGDEYYEVSVNRQTKNNMILPEIMFFFNRVYCSGSVRRWLTMDPWHSGWQKRLHNQQKQQTHQSNIHQILTIPQGPTHPTYWRPSGQNIKKI